MNSAPQAVFLSYASQDAEAARRLAEALRAAGVEVWFDQAELAGGDAWDAKIRSQIASCALFVPVISANTQARLEGYFRLEWKLAAQRTHTMAEEKAFLLPVVIDSTRDADAKVPPEFKAVQWTRLPGGEAAPAFVARVSRLIASVSYTEGPGSAPVSRVAAGVPSAAYARPAKRRRLIFAGLALGGVALGGALVFWLGPQPVTSSSAQVAPASAAPATPPAAPVAAKDKSLAVLPLENLSPDPENAFFTDGMHSEIIATLGRIPGLKVISRNSSQSFKGSSLTLAEIAEKLGVANLVTGSVRRAGDRLRITLELRRASSLSDLAINLA
jgi:TolB-like protein